VFKHCFGSLLLQDCSQVSSLVFAFAEQNMKLSVNMFHICILYCDAETGSLIRADSYHVAVYAQFCRMFLRDAINRLSEDMLYSADIRTFVFAFRYY